MILVAAFVAHGNCNELLEYCIVHHEVVLPKFILDEPLDVLTMQFLRDFKRMRSASRHRR